MRLAVVIVTFEARSRLGKHLRALAAQTSPPDMVFIINTGKEDAEAIAREASLPFPFRVISKGDVGPAGGFREGARAAFAAGYDYMILADDDALPAREDALACFRQDAEGGMDAVSGSYTNGARIVLSNHYFMVSRGVFRKVGFYFAPFFLASEDMEFPDRMSRAFKLRHDPRILISHPNRMTVDSARTYQFLRNFSVHMAISGSARAYAYSFMAYFVRCSFIAIMLRRRDFLSAFARAMADFAACRTGKGPIRGERIGLGEVPPGALGGRKAFLVAAGKRRAPFPKALDKADIEAGSDDTFDRLVGGGSGAGLLRGIAESNMRLMGKSLVLADQFLLAFPPFSITARDVYVYEEVGGSFGLLYRNNPPASFALTALLVPCGLALLPAAVLAFYAVRGRYRRMMAHEVAEDMEFCRKAEAALAAEGNA